MKAKMIETTNIHGQRIWIVEKPNGATKVFLKKSKAKTFKAKYN